MSAANTLTFAQLQFAVGVFQGVALILHRVEWFPTLASLRELVAATDSISMAIVTNDNLASLDPTDQDIIVRSDIIGLAANVETVPLPIINDYTNLPGGGLIVPANPLYLALDTGGAAAASVCRAIIYYTFKSLSDKDYIELMQMMIPGNI
jgi:hypothetical protein